MSDDLKPDDLAELSKVLREDWDSLTRRGGEMAADAIDRLIAAERARDEAVAERDRMRAELADTQLLRETVEVIAGGDGDPQEIAQQTLDMLSGALPGVDMCQPLPPSTPVSSTADPVSDAAAEPKIMRTGRANWTWRSECGGAWYISLNERAAAPYLRQIHIEAIVDLDARGLVAGIEIIDEKMPGPPLGVSAEPNRSER